MPSMPPIIYPTTTAVNVFRATSISYFKTAFSPKGARLNAGRFNRENTSALYCSLDADTALAEYYRGNIDRPCVLVPAILQICNVIDLTITAASLDKVWQDALSGDWKGMYNSMKSGGAALDFAGWSCGDEAIATNCSAILFPSTENLGGRNMAVYVEDCPTGTAVFDLVDPENEFRSHFRPTKNL